jgi:replicative DNA helicase
MGVVAPKPLGIIETATSLKLGVPLAAHPQREHDRAELARRMGVARDAPLIISSPTKLTLNAPANSARTSRADMHERLNLDQGELAPDASGRRPN